MGMGRPAESRGWNRREVATQARHRAIPMPSHTAGNTGSSAHTPKVDADQVAVDAAGKPISANTTPAHMQPGSLIHAAEHLPHHKCLTDHHGAETAARDIRDVLTSRHPQEWHGMSAKPRPLRHRGLTYVQDACSCVGSPCGLRCCGVCPGRGLAGDPCLC